MNIKTLLSSKPIIKSLACFILVLCSFYMQGQDWQRYKSDSFEILLPKLPEKRSKDLYTGLGMLKTVNYSVKPEVEDANFFYSINVVEYPAELISVDSMDLIDTMMVAHVNELSATLKSKIIYATESKYQGRPSYLFRLMDDLSGQVVKGRVVFAYDRMYSFMVFTLKDKSLNDNIDKFLESLRIL